MWCRVTRLTSRYFFEALWNSKLVTQHHTEDLTPLLLHRSQYQRVRLVSDIHHKNSENMRLINAGSVLHTNKIALFLTACWKWLKFSANVTLTSTWWCSCWLTRSIWLRTLQRVRQTSYTRWELANNSRSLTCGCFVTNTQRSTVICSQLCCLMRLLLPLWNNRFYT